MIVPDITNHRHATAEVFAQAVADRIAKQLRLGVEDHGAASLAVPGGTTPGPIFDALAKMQLCWARVAVTLTDERWVPVSDRSSNEALVRHRLLQGPAAEAHMIGLYDASPKPSLGIPGAETALRQLSRPLDAVLLGMGGDGHFASLFPGLPDLAEGLNPESATICIASDAPINGQPRLSLSLGFLLRSRLILLAIRGADKLAVIERAKTAAASELPIAAILRQGRVPVEIHFTEE
ncbi:6-phosphogluconolactonase [Dongia soli]|uniref:6-phosphogluconolactonase n=1 Tax=Dongia soli TaxID=600628 RepID=A0ABU5EAH5_9PROT|nr:6-phosphogluconolactonase [Dongia soli]MDY0883277.1 6-phosphogluconolactonase [Dongia soli]